MTPAAGTDLTGGPRIQGVVGTPRQQVVIRGPSGKYFLTF